MTVPLAAAGAAGATGAAAGAARAGGAASAAGRFSGSGRAAGETRAAGARGKSMDIDRRSPKNDQLNPKERERNHEQPDSDESEEENEEPNRKNRTPFNPFTGSVVFEDPAPEIQMPESGPGKVVLDEKNPLSEEDLKKKHPGSASIDEEGQKPNLPVGTRQGQQAAATPTPSAPGQAGVEGTPKELASKLKRLQKAAPELAKDLGTGSPLGQAKLMKKIIEQVDFTVDWLFIPFLLTFALLKDLFDIAFAAIPGVGIIFSFVTTVLLLILTIIIMLITGSTLKNRGVAKYIVGLAIGAVAEAIPVFGWLPVATIEVFVIYGLTLFDRMIESLEEEKAEKQQEQLPEYAAADNYYDAEERLAA